MQTIEQAPTTDPLPAEHNAAVAFAQAGLDRAQRRLETATTDTQRGAALYDVHVARATLREVEAT